MSDDIPSVAEAMAEIRRLRETAEGQDETVEKLTEIIGTQDGVIKHLRARVAELEETTRVLRKMTPTDTGSSHRSDRPLYQPRKPEGVAAAIMQRGTLEQPTPDEPTTITRNVPMDGKQ